MTLFGSDYAQRFGLPAFPWTGMDPQGGMLGPGFSGMEQGQPVPGVPGAGTLNARNSPSVAGPAGSPVGGGLNSTASQPDAGIGQSANPSVPALQTGNPLASPLAVGSNSLAAGAGAAPQPGAGAPAASFVGGAGRGY